jgi:hypothetical protein
MILSTAPLQQTGRNSSPGKWGRMSSTLIRNISLKALFTVNTTIHFNYRLTKVAQSLEIRLTVARLRYPKADCRHVQAYPFTVMELITSTIWTL